MLVAYNPLSAQNSYNPDGTLNKHVNKYKKYWQHQVHNIYYLINHFNIRVHTIHITLNEQNNRWYLCSGKVILDLSSNMNIKKQNIIKNDNTPAPDATPGPSVPPYTIDNNNFTVLDDINKYILKQTKSSDNFIVYDQKKYHYKNEKICSFETVADLIFYLNYIFNFDIRKIINSKTHQFNYSYQIQKKCSFIIVLENSKYMEKYISDIDNIFTGNISNTSLCLNDNVLSNIKDIIDYCIWECNASDKKESFSQIYETCKNDPEYSKFYKKCLKYYRIYALQVYYNIDYFGVRYKHRIKILSKYENDYIDGKKIKNKVKNRYAVNQNLNFIYYKQNQYKWNDNLTFDENINKFISYLKQNNIKLPKDPKILNDRINLLNSQRFTNSENYYILDWIGFGEKNKQNYEYLNQQISLFEMFGYTDKNNYNYFQYDSFPKIDENSINYIKENKFFVNDNDHKKISISNYFIKNLINRICNFCASLPDELQNKFSNMPIPVVTTAFPNFINHNEEDF